MTRIPRDVALTNDELASIYDYLQGNISQQQLSKELKRTRTNTYYYIGRAVHYWLSIGVVQFNNVTSQEELGGSKPKKKEKK
jgi:hypothetical protein